MSFGAPNVSQNAFRLRMNLFKGVSPTCFPFLPSAFAAQEYACAWWLNITHSITRKYKENIALLLAIFTLGGKQLRSKVKCYWKLYEFISTGVLAGVLSFWQQSPLSFTWTRIGSIRNWIVRGSLLKEEESNSHLLFIQCLLTWLSPEWKTVSCVSLDTRASFRTKRT